MNTLLDFVTASVLGFICAAAFIALVTWPRRTPAEREAARRAAAVLDSTHHQRAMDRLLADLHPKEDQT